MEWLSTGLPSAPAPHARVVSGFDEGVHCHHAALSPVFSRHGPFPEELTQRFQASIRCVLATAHVKIPEYKHMYTSRETWTGRERERDRERERQTEHKTQKQTKHIATLPSRELDLTIPGTRSSSGRCALLDLREDGRRAILASRHTQQEYRRDPDLITLSAPSRDLLYRIQFARE